MRSLDPSADATRPLAGRTALVTGAGRRVGLEIAARLAAAGARVALHAHTSLAGAEALEAQIRARGGSACSLAADLTRPEEVERLLGRAVERLGPLDLLVNSAGAFEPTPLAETSPSEAAETLLRLTRLNAATPLALSLDFARRLRPEALDAGIVNVACTSALRPWPGYAPYAASKAALVSVTRALARALAPRVRVNAVAPGPVLPPDGASEEEVARVARTTLVQRWGSSADVAEAVLHLATAHYVTGVVLAVDGGRTLR